jgi:hypothetical protein
VIPDEVLAFIQLNFPHRFCVSCLASKLDAAPMEIRNVLGALIDEGVILFGRRQCDGCNCQFDVFAPEPARNQT